jgi:hypothetical protein
MSQQHRPPRAAPGRDRPQPQERIISRDQLNQRIGGQEAIIQVEDFTVYLVFEQGTTKARISAFLSGQVGPRLRQILSGDGQVPLEDIIVNPAPVIFERFDKCQLAKLSATVPAGTKGTLSRWISDGGILNLGRFEVQGPWYQPDSVNPGEQPGLKAMVEGWKLRAYLVRGIPKTVWGAARQGFLLEAFDWNATDFL